MIKRYEKDKNNSIVLESSCSPFEKIPFNAVDDLLTQTARRFPYSKTPCVKEKVKQYNKDNFFLLKYFIHKELRKNNIVLIIDNFQWADIESISVLIELLKKKGKKRLRLILLARNRDGYACKHFYRELLKNDIVKKFKTIQLKNASFRNSMKFLTMFSINEKLSEEILNVSKGIPEIIERLSYFIRYNKYKCGDLIKEYIIDQLADLPQRSYSILLMISVLKKAVQPHKLLILMNLKSSDIYLIRILIKKKLIKVVKINNIFMVKMYHRIFRYSLLKNAPKETKKEYELIKKSYFKKNL